MAHTPSELSIHPGENGTIMCMTSRLLCAGGDRHEWRTHAQKRARVDTNIHARTPVSRTVKNVPEVRVPGRPRGEVAEGKTLIFPGAGELTARVRKAGLAAPPLFMRPRSCPPPSAC